MALWTCASAVMRLPRPRCRCVTAVRELTWSRRECCHCETALMNRRLHILPGGQKLRPDQ